MAINWLAATPVEVAAEAERRRVLREQGKFDEPVGLPALPPERARELGILKTARQLNPATEEHDAQVEVFDWIDGEGYAEWPELALFFAVPNASRRSRRQGGMLKREGMRKGMLDIVGPVPRDGYGGLYCEQKTETGRLTPTQRARAELLAACGNKVVVCRSSADTIAEIKAYMRLARSHKAYSRERIARAALALAEAIRATA